MCLELPKIFRQTSPAFSRQIVLWVRCRSRWAAVVCRGFVTVVLNNFTMEIVISWIVRVFIDARFASPMMASTEVVRFWPVMARPAKRCDLIGLSNVELTSSAATKMLRIPHSNALLRSRLHGWFYGYIPYSWRLIFAGLLSVAFGCNLQEQHGERWYAGGHLSHKKFWCGIDSGYGLSLGVPSPSRLLRLAARALKCRPAFEGHCCSLGQVGCQHLASPVG